MVLMNPPRLLIERFTPPDDMPKVQVIPSSTLKEDVSIELRLLLICATDWINFLIPFGLIALTRVTTTWYAIFP